MEEDRVQAITRLLTDAEEAHGVYEATELNGVYDTEWPSWYATHVVEHGLGHALGRDLSVPQLADFLTTAYTEFEQTDPKPTEPWSDYVARRMSAEL